MAAVIGGVLLACHAVLLTSKSTCDPKLNDELGKVIQGYDIYAR